MAPIPAATAMLPYELALERRKPWRHPIALMKDCQYILKKNWRNGFIGRFVDEAAFVNPHDLAKLESDNLRLVCCNPPKALFNHHMPEGGLYPWKVQKTKSLPRAHYHRMSLGEPPAGMEWTQNAETREWTLREISSTATPITVDAEATKISTDDTIPLAHAEPIPQVLHHVVTETDTMQGICLKYKVSATQLRQANCFSGTNLKLAPKVLKIPNSNRTIAPTTNIIQSEHENKIAQVYVKHKSLSRKEVRAYLEMNDWNIERTLNEIQQDEEFERNSRGQFASN